MNSRKRQGRALFIAFVCASWIAVFISVPLANALRSSDPSASVGVSRDAKPRNPTALERARTLRAERAARRDLPTDK